MLIVSWAIPTKDNGLYTTLATYKGKRMTAMEVVEMIANKAKIFGIGNILLCDEGIGVKVVQSLKDRLEYLGYDIEVIIGETDALYCMNKIDDYDKVIIVDSTYFMARPGLVTVKRLEQCDKFINYEY